MTKTNQKQTVLFVAQQGMTLPELLIALSVFAMIASAGVYSLRLAIDGREQLASADARLRQWQITRAVLREDFLHLVQRQVRGQDGIRSPSSLVGGRALVPQRPIVGETPLVGFVRRGIRNQDQSNPRSELQYIQYVLIENRLVRRIRTYLDAAPDIGGRASMSQDLTLIDKLEDATFSFLFAQTTTGLQWVEEWPTQQREASAPPVVRLTTTSADLGQVDHLFWIGATALDLQVK
ncbi:MAG: type II secretion system minor pseudopilin GspJ [Pseudomonadota bacterium]